MARKKLRHGNQPLVQADLSCRSLSQNPNAPVAQRTRLLSGQMRVGIPPGAPNLLSGCPVLLTPGNRNRQTREGQADYTR